MAGSGKQVILLRSRAFTVMEILVVLAIFAVIISIAIPAWLVFLPTFALNSASRQIQSELHRIKMQAIASNSTFQLNFSESADNYTIERVGGATAGIQGIRALPEQVDLRNSIKLGFTSRGTATPGTGGTVRLCNSKGAGTNIVLSSTGRVRVCKIDVCDGAC